MGLFVAMLPFYILGNMHCMGMCGPLVALLSRHQYRYFYFLGRSLAFASAAGVAAAAGLLLTEFLQRWQLSAAVSFIFAVVIGFSGLSLLFKFETPLMRHIAIPVQKALGRFLSLDTPLTAFAMGFSTVLLPCGQSMVVFAACALTADPLIGFANGMAFALLTSPSLWMAMHLPRLWGGFRRYNDILMGVLALIVAVLALARGLADLQIISHLVLNPSWSPEYHVILY